MTAVGEEKFIYYWDLRESAGPVKTIATDSHASACVTIGDFIITGNDRGNLTTWSLKMPNKPIAEFVGHVGGVGAIKRSPSIPDRIASSGKDGKIIVWDYQREASGYKLFEHAGHMGGKVIDFAWHPTQPETVASVAESHDGRGVLQGIFSLALLKFFFISNSFVLSSVAVS